MMETTAKKDALPERNRRQSDDKEEDDEEAMTQGGPDFIQKPEMETTSHEGANTGD